MTEFPVSMIHPDAPEILSAMALFTAPIDLEAAAARVGTLWNESVDFEWEEGGSILRFALRDVVVLLSPVPGEAVPEKGRLPAHSFHVALTCFAPMEDIGGFGAGARGSGAGVRGFEAGAGGFGREASGSGGEVGDRAADAGGSGIPGFTGEEIAELKGLPREVGLRRRALTAHVVLAEVADALMREESAVGLFRPELGVVQPPRMVVELADLLSKGQAPIPLWVGIRVSKPDLVYGRTLGLPLFGHLDLEVVGSLHSEEEVYAMLSNVVDYLLSADAFLLPGQSVGYRDGKDLAISQAVSPADRAAVLHIGF
jgi:hypothetical protein